MFTLRAIEVIGWIPEFVLDDVDIESDDNENLEVNEEGEGSFEMHTWNDGDSEGVQDTFAHQPEIEMADPAIVSHPDVADQNTAPVIDPAPSEPVSEHES